MVEFSDGIDRGSQLLVEAAQEKSLPVKDIILEGEDHAAETWEKPLVLIRPDGHVAWRSNYLLDRMTTRAIIETVLGAPNSVPVKEKKVTDIKEAFAISDTNGVVTIQSGSFELENVGDFRSSIKSEYCTSYIKIHARSLA